MQAKFIGTSNFISCSTSPVHVYHEWTVESFIFISKNLQDFATKHEFEFVEFRQGHLFHINIYSFTLEFKINYYM